jgi:hypothetical protein
MPWRRNKQGICSRCSASDECDQRSNAQSTAIFDEFFSLKIVSLFRNETTRASRPAIKVRSSPRSPLVRRANRLIVLPVRSSLGRTQRAGGYPATGPTFLHARLSARANCMDRRNTPYRTPISLASLRRDEAVFPGTIALNGAINRRRVACDSLSEVGDDTKAEKCSS